MVVNADIIDIFEFIYPSCLKIKKANTSDNNIVFLDLSIKLNDKFLILDVYDKRRDFNFHTQTLPHWFTNLRKKVFINIINNQLNRFFRICNNEKNLSKQIFRLTCVMFYYNFYPHSFLCKYINLFKKFLKK